jgi:hypothetical protein
MRMPTTISRVERALQHSWSGWPFVEILGSLGGMGGVPAAQMVGTVFIRLLIGGAVMTLGSFICVDALARGE